MSDLQPLIARRPLAEVSAPKRTGATFGVPGVSVIVRGDVETVTVIARSRRSLNCMTTLSNWLGVPVVDASKRARNRNGAVISVGPGRWLVSVHGDGATGEIERLRLQLASLASVTEQGDGQVVLHMSGPRVRDALCKGVAIDLDPRVFTPGDTAGTMIAHLAVQISCLEADTYEIIGAASTADNLWHWLERSAAEFGLDVVQG